MNTELPQKRAQFDSTLNIHSQSKDIFRSLITKNPFTNRDIAELLLKDWYPVVLEHNFKSTMNSHCFIRGL